MLLSTSTMCNMLSLTTHRACARCRARASARQDATAPVLLTLSHHERDRTADTTFPTQRDTADTQAHRAHPRTSPARPGWRLGGVVYSDYLADGRTSGL